MREEILRRLADLVVRFGANVQPGQIVAISGEPGKEALVREIAAAAYLAGARFVDVSWFDPWVKRARVMHAAEETLEWVPPWYGERALAIGREHGARIALSGPAAPGLLSDLDPVRAGRDRLPSIKENLEVTNRRESNWSIVPCPTPAWAQLVYPDDEPEAALDRLYGAIERVCRLDEDDPVAAWSARADQLVAAGERLTARGFHALHYEGPGTDLTVGLLPGVRWAAARMATVFDVTHMPNLPTEEVFTSPDPERTNGIVTSTKPLVLIDGTVVRDLVVRFENGHAVEVTASSGQDTLRTVLERDETATRLGEIALVDGDGRIGALDTVFFDTLLDENAASHIAFGTGFPFLAGDDEQAAGRINTSEVHLDFMIGGPDLTVTGVTAQGDRVPVLAGGRWGV